MQVRLGKDDCLGSWLEHRRLVPQNWMQLLRALNDLVDKAWPGKSLYDESTLLTKPDDAQSSLKVMRAIAAGPFVPVAQSRRWQTLENFLIPAMRKRQTELKRRMNDLVKEKEVSIKRVSAAKKQLEAISALLKCDGLNSEDLTESMTEAISGRASDVIDALKKAILSCRPLVTFYRGFADAINAFMILKKQRPYLDDALPCIDDALSSLFDQSKLSDLTFLSALDLDYVQLEAFITTRLERDWLDEKLVFGDELEIPEITREEAEAFLHSVRAVEARLCDSDNNFILGLRQDVNLREQYLLHAQSLVQLVKGADANQARTAAQLDELTVEHAKVKDELDDMVKESSNLRELLSESLSTLIECEVVIEVS